MTCVITDMGSSQQLRVLVFRREHGHLGGVAALMDIFARHSAPSITRTDFIIGQRLPGRLRWPAPLQTALDAVKLLITLMRTRYDVYHVNPSLDTKSVLRDGLFIALLRSFGGGKIVSFVHGWEQSLAITLERVPLGRFLLRETLGASDQIIVLANAFKSELAAMGFRQEKIRVFPTAFDPNLFVGLRRERSDAELRLLYMARLVADKGAHELLTAFDALRREYSGLRLCIAGDGPERAALRDRISQLGLGDSVTMPGYVQGREKAQLLLDCDIFALPTYYGEGCPVSLLEAMAAGAPLVVGRAGGIPDLVENGVNGVLLDAVDPRAVERALRELIDDPLRCARTRETNRTLAWRRFEGSVVTGALERVYRAALAQR